MSRGQRRSVEGSGTRLGSESLQPFDQVEVGEGSMIAVDVRLAIGRHSDGTNPFDAGRVGWHKLPPKGSASRGQVQPINLGGQLAGAIDVKGVTVGRPFYGFFPG